MQKLAQLMFVLCLTIILGNVPRSEAAINREELIDLVAQLQYAWYTENLGDLLAISERLESEKPRPATAAWQQYYAAYGYFRAASLAEEDYVIEFLDRCEDITRALQKESSGFAEALVLRGGCAAWLARVRPISAVLAPSRAVRALSKAARIDPENPRLLLQQAEAVMGRKAFSDEYRDPLTLLKQAVDQFERRIDADPLTPDWGEIEALRYLAELSLEAGDRRQARDALEQALQIAPDFRPAVELMQSLRTGG